MMVCEAGDFQEFRSFFALSLGGHGGNCYLVQMFSCIQDFVSHVFVV